MFFILPAMHPAVFVWIHLDHIHVQKWHFHTSLSHFRVESLLNLLGVPDSLEIHRESYMLSSSSENSLGVCTGALIQVPQEAQLLDWSAASLLRDMTELIVKNSM